MHSTKRWLFATLLHSYHSSLPTYVSCTFMQARDIKFLPNFFPDPITDLRFLPRWKSKPPNQIKNKKNRSSRSCRQRLYPPAYPSRDTFLLPVLFFFFLFSPPFPSAKGTGQTSEAIQSQNSLRKFPRGGVLITTKQPCHRQHDDEKE